MPDSWQTRWPKHAGRRLVALALAVAVPAFAAPNEWRPFTLFESAEANLVKPMGFETAGESFPGSAFYYLADQPYIPPAGGSITSGGTANPFAESAPEDP